MTRTHRNNYSADCLFAGPPTALPSTHGWHKLRGHDTQGARVRRLSPASSLSYLSLCRQGLGKHQASKRPALLCFALLDRSAVELTWATGEQGGCPAFIWQWAGGRTHTRFSVLPSSVLAPLQTMGPGTFYPFPPPPRLNSPVFFVSANAFEIIVVCLH